MGDRAGRGPPSHPGSAISMRAAFAVAATRGAWRAAGPRRHHRHPGSGGAGVLRGVGDPQPGRRGTRGRCGALVHRSAPRVPALPPRLDPSDPLPRCRQTVHRVWCCMAETTEATGALDPDTPAPRSRGARLLRGFGAALPPRLVRLGVAVFAGLLLCISFPDRLVVVGGAGAGPAELGAGRGADHAGRWLRLRAAVRAGLLYPLLPWISGLVGPVPWLALSVMEALFPALFGLFAVAVRRLPGWPLWFALVWSLQEWLKSSVPFGGFPWGVVGFGQANGPFLSLAQLGGCRCCRSRSRCSAPRCARWPSRSFGGTGTAVPTRPTGTRPARGGAARHLYLRRPAQHRAGRAAGAAGRYQGGQRTEHHGGGGPGQRAPAGAGVQQPAPRRAGQPRPGNRPTRRGRPRRPGAAAAVRHLAGELLGHRPDDQRRRRAADRRRRPGRRRADPGRCRHRPAGLDAGQPDRLQQRRGVGPGERSRRTPRQADRPAVRRVPALAGAFSGACRPTPTGPATSFPAAEPASCTPPVCRSGGDLLGGHLRPCAARVGPQRRAGAGGAHQQRHLRPEHERTAIGLRQGPRRRTRPLPRRRGHHRDQRCDRTRRPRDQPHPVLHPGLPRRPGAAEDRPDTGHPLGPAVQWALVSAAVAVLVAAMLHNGWFMRPLRRRRHRTESPPERGGPTSARAERHDEGAS